MMRFIRNHSLCLKTIFPLSKKDKDDNFVQIEGIYAVCDKIF